MTEQPDTRPRVRVTLPHDQGAIVAWLVRWAQRPDGAWEAVVSWYRWAATAPVGDPIPKSEPMGDQMTVPAAAVEQIDGEDYRRVEHIARTTDASGPAPRIDQGLGTLGERTERGKRRSGGMS